MHVGCTPLEGDGPPIMQQEVNYSSGRFPAWKLLSLVEVLEGGWNHKIRLKFKAAPGTFHSQVHAHASP